MAPIVAPALLCLLITERLAGRWGLPARKVIALRQGLPNNPTTEMDLTLWQVSQQIKANPAARRLFAEETPEAVAAA